MEADPIPELVRRLISESIPSIERLEILLLLFEHPERAWTVAEIEGQIRSSNESIERNVLALVDAQLLAAAENSGARPVFRFGPKSPATHGVVEALAAAYHSRRLTVVELIYADRQNAARSFSDAFRIRTPKR